MTMKVTLANASSDPERTICYAARNDYMAKFAGDLSFAEVMDPIDGDNIKQKKKTLINNLLSHGHYGPFEHVHATFAVKGISRSCMAQLTRHRHASFDVQSMRYVSFDDVDPAPGEAVVKIPEFDTDTVAGRNAEFTPEYEDTEDIERQREERFTAAVEEAFNAYDELLDMGVAPENARMVLPIGTRVNMVFTVNARTLMHIADMRAAGDAQWEIRELTGRVLELAEEWCPTTFGYYEAEMKGRKNRLAP